MRGFCFFVTTIWLYYLKEQGIKEKRGKLNHWTEEKKTLSSLFHMHPQGADNELWVAGGTLQLPCN